MTSRDEAAAVQASAGSGETALAAALRRAERAEAEAAELHGRLEDCGSCVNLMDNGKTVGLMRARAEAAEKEAGVRLDVLRNVLRGYAQQLPNGWVEVTLPLWVLQDVCAVVHPDATEERAPSAGWLPPEEAEQREAGLRQQLAAALRERDGYRQGEADSMRDVAQQKARAEAAERQVAALRDTLALMISHLAHQDQDANHAWMAQKMRAALTSSPPSGWLPPEVREQVAAAIRDYVAGGPSPRALRAALALLEGHTSHCPAGRCDDASGHLPCEHARREDP